MILCMTFTELSEQLLKLQLASALLARKQHNYSLAQRLLVEQASFLLESHTDSAMTFDLDTLKTTLKQLQGHSKVSKLDALRIERESAKLIHCIGKSTVFKCYLTRHIPIVVYIDRFTDQFIGLRTKSCIAISQTG